MVQWFKYEGAFESLFRGNDHFSPLAEFFIFQQNRPNADITYIIWATRLGRLASRSRQSTFPSPKIAMVMPQGIQFWHSRVRNEQTTEIRRLITLLDSVL